MYAVIKTGGKQYRVSPGDTLEIELLAKEPGETVSFDEVLMVVDGDKTKVGTPLLKGASVTGEILSHGRQKKIRIIKHRRRKNYRRQQGHRQHFTEVKIGDISA